MVSDITFDIDKDTERTIYLDVLFPIKTKVMFRKLIEDMTFDKRRLNRNLKKLRNYLEVAYENRNDPLYKKNLKWIDSFIKERKEGNKK